MTEALHAPQPSELVEHFLADAISNSPQPLKDLAEFLSNALSEDDWNTADRLLLALALRNRTSEPEAGAVAWRARMRPDGEWMVLDAKYVPSRAADSAVEVQPLFDHPATATADKLRVAVEALEKIADEAPYRSGYCQSDVEYGPKLSDIEMQSEARQALAALNEQPQ